MENGYFIDSHDDEGYFTDEELADFIFENYCEDSLKEKIKSSMEVTGAILSPYQAFL